MLASYAPSLLNFRGPLIRDLLKAGHQVSAGAPDIKEVSHQLEALGVSAHNTPLRRNGIGIGEDLRYQLNLYRLMRKIRPDLVLTYTIKPNIWGAFAAKALGIPSVSIVTGLGFAFTGAGKGTGPKGRFVGFIAKLLYRFAAFSNRRIIFQNPDDREEFISSGCLQDSSKAALVDGSGVDMDHYARSDIVLAPVFLMIARLLVSKGVQEYLEAARQLRAQHPNVRCLLVGPRDGGPDAVDPALIERAQIEGSIEYLGSVEDVRPLIAKSAVYVLPSYREGTPRSVLEAMSMGRPIITTDVPGCRETVIDVENGFLVSMQDSGALMQAMQRFVENPSLIRSMGQRSYEIARDRYDVRKVNVAMLEFLDL